MVLEVAIEVEVEVTTSADASDEEEMEGFFRRGGMNPGRCGGSFEGEAEVESFGGKCMIGSDGVRRVSRDGELLGLSVTEDSVLERPSMRLESFVGVIGPLAPILVVVESVDMERWSASRFDECKDIESPSFRRFSGAVPDLAKVEVEVVEGPAS